jgi:hypothetical protein
MGRRMIKKIHAREESWSRCGRRSTHATNTASQATRKAVPRAVMSIPSVTV